VRRPGREEEERRRRRRRRDSPLGVGERGGRLESGERTGDDGRITMARSATQPRPGLGCCEVVDAGETIRLRGGLGCSHVNGGLAINPALRRASCAG
jgi:hypothetical protein